MDTFSVEITPDGDRLALWVPEIEHDTYVQFEDEVDLAARNLIYLHTGRPRKSFNLSFSWL